jgi:hypothetical protein
MGPVTSLLAFHPCQFPVVGRAVKHTWVYGDCYKYNWQKSIIPQFQFAPRMAHRTFYHLRGCVPVPKLPSVMGSPRINHFKEVQLISCAFVLLFLPRLWLLVPCKTALTYAFRWFAKATEIWIRTVPSKITVA